MPLIAIAISGIVSCAPPRAPEETLPAPRITEAFQRAREHGRAIVRVRARHDLRGTSATGFVVGHCTIVTAAHAVPDGWSVTIITRAPNRRRFAGRVILRDAGNDLAVITSLPLGIPTLTLNARTAHNAVAAAIGGFPLSGPFVLRNATVGVSRPVTGLAAHDVNALPIRARLASGMSGAPIIDEHGDAIGVAIAKGRSDSGYGVPAAAIRGAVRRARPRCRRRTEVGA